MATLVGEMIGWRAMMVLMAFGWVACGGVNEEEEEKPVGKAAPRLVGRIGKVNRAEGFVLVEGYGDWSLSEGLILSGVGDEERTSSLLVTGERSGRFVAADLKSGEAQVGDLVYARPLPEPGAPEAPPGATEDPAAGGGSVTTP